MRQARTRIAALLLLAPAGAATAQDHDEWPPEASAESDFQNALSMWSKGHYGGLLFYHDGKGPLGQALYLHMDSRDETAPRPEEWNVIGVDCASETECSATAIVKFTDEEAGGLRRFRLVREPGQFWGLYDEQRLSCPQGYRLQYQGICFNIADEQSDDPAIEIRSAEPVAAD